MPAPRETAGPITGTHVGSQPSRRSKTYSTETRVCADPGCGTRLSRYNKRDYCDPHAPLRFPRVRGRAGRF